MKNKFYTIGKPIEIKEEEENYINTTYANPTKYPERIVKQNCSVISEILKRKNNPNSDCIISKAPEFLALYESLKNHQGDPLLNYNEAKRREGLYPVDTFSEKLNEIKEEVRRDIFTHAIRNMYKQFNPEQFFRNYEAISDGKTISLEKQNKYSIEDIKKGFKQSQLSQRQKEHIIFTLDNILKQQ